MRRRYYTTPEAREILLRARICELRRLAAETTETFNTDRRCTELTDFQIATEMLAVLDARMRD
jgi:hypothetical protein